MLFIKETLAPLVDGGAVFPVSERALLLLLLPTKSSRTHKLKVTFWLSGTRSYLSATEFERRGTPDLVDVVCRGV